tara:strand:+ start:93 stop:701 length:609 start_codon:yes stop_codon:yes gene_type:complete
MGKSKRTRGKLKGKTQEVAYVRPAPVPDDIHPVDMSGVTAVCGSCQSDNEAPSIDDLMNDDSIRGTIIIFKYWLPTDADCAVCQHKEPYQVYDFEASGVATEKMFEIVAACELKCGRKILDVGHQVDDQSREVLKIVFSQIRQTYKDVKVAKRPVTTIRQVNDIFFQLDHDTRLRPRDKITFKCKNGSVSFSLNTAMLAFRV